MKRSSNRLNKDCGCVCAVDRYALQEVFFDVLGTQGRQPTRVS